MRSMTRLRTAGLKFATRHGLTPNSSEVLALHVNPPGSSVLACLLVFDYLPVLVGSLPVHVCPLLHEHCPFFVLSSCYGVFLLC